VEFKRLGLFTFFIEFINYRDILGWGGGYEKNWCFSIRINNLTGLFRLSAVHLREKRFQSVQLMQKSSLMRIFLA